MKEKQSKDDLLEAEPTIRSSRRKSHIRDTLRLILFSPRGAPQVDATRLYTTITRYLNALREHIMKWPAGILLYTFLAGFSRHSARSWVIIRSVW